MLPPQNVVSKSSDFFGVIARLIGILNLPLDLDAINKQFSRAVKFDHLHGRDTVKFVIRQFHFNPPKVVRLDCV